MSKISDKIEELIKTGFPLLHYAKEKYVPYRGRKLFFDFTIPELNIYIEVQGRQHYVRIPFFHNKAGTFKSQRYRDQLKTEWCAKQDVILLEFSYKEIDKLTVDKFRNIILKAVRDYNERHRVA